MLKNIFMDEVWKTYNNKEIEFSNLGRVRRNGNIVNYKNVRVGSYPCITINGKRILLHRIIAELFCERKSELQNIVDHINGIRDDNRSENLRWVTTLENNQNRRYDGICNSRQIKSNEIEIDYKIYKDLFEKKCEAYNNLFDHYIKLKDMYTGIISKSCRL